jgi:hypothetical protein
VGTEWNGELTQLDEGYLDENTTLVTLSVGGNDALFVPILTACLNLPPLFPTRDCTNTVLTEEGDTQPLSVAEPARLNGTVRAGLVTLLKEINKRAPNAKIMLMGYPRLFENTPACDLLLGASDRAWLTQMADTMAASMQLAVDQTRAAVPHLQITFANPISEFWGGSGVCGAHQALHGLEAVLTPGESGPLDDYMPTGWPRLGKTQASFHPTIDGARLYANVMQRVLRETWGI